MVGGYVSDRNLDKQFYSMPQDALLETVARYETTISSRAMVLRGVP